MTATMGVVDLWPRKALVYPGDCRVLAMVTVGVLSDAVMAEDVGRWRRKARRMPGRLGVLPATKLFLFLPSWVLL